MSADGPPSRRIWTRLFQPVDIAWLVGFRVLFGLILAVSMERFIAYGWIDELLVDPRWRFHYWGFHWVEPLGRANMHTLFGVMVGLGLAMAAGFCFRVSALLFALGLTYIQLIDVSTYLNHYYLAALLTWLIAVSPAHRAYSVDAWLASRWRRSAPRPPTIAVAWLWLFRVQIGAVYVFAGLAKLQSDWLLHGQPLGIWLGANTSLPVLGRLFTVSGAPLLMSWAGFLFDGTIVFWLSLRRTRPWAYAVVLTFHAMTRLLFDIGMFPLIMSAAALVFFPPSWPRTLLATLLRRPLRAPDSPDAQDAPGVTPPRVHRVAVGLGVAWCAVQILMPLRGHLYGGNVLWHEQGMRFSWRVMVRAKGGSTTFLVRSKETGRVVHVSPRTYLTPFQENEMSGQPDLILQLAHRIRDDFTAQGKDVEVRADSQVSLNGRRAQTFIDPDVDLGTVHDGLGTFTWVTPAPAAPPPPTRPVL